MASTTTSEPNWSSIDPAFRRANIVHVATAILVCEHAPRTDGTPEREGDVVLDLTLGR